MFLFTTSAEASSAFRSELLSGTDEMRAIPRRLTMLGSDKETSSNSILSKHWAFRVECPA
jgi:hypothetical protein